MFSKIFFTFILFIFNASGAIKKDFHKIPNKKSVKTSFYNSLDTPHFKVPFFLGVFTGVLYDGELSEHFSSQNPIYGSNKNAQKWSDGLLLSLIPMMLYTGYNVDLDDSTVKNSRTKFMLLQSSIILFDFASVHLIKTNTRRIRPDESDNLSFPSGHSSVSSGLSRTITNNIKNSRYKGTSYGLFLQHTALSTSMLVALGRVEAKKHHVSDVLFGNAFGAFISDFLYSSFLEQRSVSPIVFQYDLNKNLGVNFTHYF